MSKSDIEILRAARAVVRRLANDEQTGADLTQSHERIVAARGLNRLVDTLSALIRDLERAHKNAPAAG